MTNKITSLTPEQTAQLDTYRDKWLAIGLSTEPVNLEKAKEAVILAYQLAGLAAPTRFELADSPIHAISIVKKYSPSLTDEDIFDSMMYGNHDASWLAFYEYFRDVVGIEECKKLDGIIALGKHSGWVNMYDDLVVFHQRPVEIHFDDQKRLHCDHGPAIQYRDGFSVYAWHGVRIPGDWIEKKGTALTPKKALTWENIEQRRAACEILGWNNIITDLKAKIIDEDDDPMIGTLVEVNLPDLGKEKFLKVVCGTGREFAIPVPKEMKSALQANAWTFGVDDVNKFDIPEVRT